MSALLTGFVGLVGVAMGFLFQQAGQRRKFLSDSRYEAYLLFLRSLAGPAATPPGSETRWTAVREMIEAKSRIALFGSRDVVVALSEFSADNAKVNRTNFDELARIIALMRSDVGANRIDNLDRHLRRLLFEASNQK